MVVELPKRFEWLPNARLVGVDHGGLLVGFLDTLRYNAVLNAWTRRHQLSDNPAPAEGAHQ